MLVSVASTKGSPGVTSTALALASVWPRPAVLLEADPAGGDLAYRCRAANGGPVIATRGLLHLAAAVRGGAPDGAAASGGLVSSQSERLACGVALIHGVARSTQARALSGLWSAIASACAEAEVDVIADLGRIDRTSPAMALAERSTHLLVVVTTTLESVMHLRENAHDVLGSFSSAAAPAVHPVVVAPDAHAARDRSDLDHVLEQAGIPARATLSLPLDPKALARLEQGESPTSRLGRTLLLRGAKGLAASLSAPTVVVT